MTILIKPILIPFKSQISKSNFLILGSIENNLIGSFQILSKPYDKKEGGRNEFF